MSDDLSGLLKDEPELRAEAVPAGWENVLGWASTYVDTLDWGVRHAARIGLATARRHVAQDPIGMRLTAIACVRLVVEQLGITPGELYDAPPPTS